MFRGLSFRNSRGKSEEAGPSWSPVEIKLDRVTKRFPSGAAALDSVCLTVNPGEKLVVLGASGSGKSTLLRIIAGLESLTAGRVEIGGADQAEVPPHRRPTALIFQHPALLPHRTVFENLAFGLRARGSAEIVAAHVEETAVTLGLSGLLDRFPATLSGGERQRVAIGRAIAWRPRILLLDEPFSSLDSPLRASLRDQVHALHRQFGMTLIHVTHDQGEAFAMGDRIAILERGRIVQCDSPERIYEWPNHRSIGRFVGNPPMNVLPCEIERNSSGLTVDLIGEEPIRLGFDGRADNGLLSSLRVGDRRRWDLGIRPEHLSLIPDNDSRSVTEDSQAPLARVERVEFQGHERWIHLLLGRNVLLSRDLGRSSPKPGDFVRVRFDFGRASWFDSESGLALASVENPFASGGRPC